MRRALLLTIFLLASSAVAQTLGEEVRASDPVLVAAEGQSIGAASNGRDFLVVWRGSRVYAQRISAEGVPATTYGVAVSGAVAPGSTAVASNGNDYIIAFDDETAVRTAFIPADPDAPGLVREVAPAGDGVLALQLVASRGGFLLVIHDTTRDQIRGVLLDRGGSAISAPFVIHEGEDLFSGVTAASDGTDYLLAYATPGPVLKTQRITSTGVVGLPRQVMTGITAARLAHDGSTFSLLWNDGATAWTARTDGEGFLAEAPVQIGEQLVALIAPDASLAILTDLGTITAVPLREEAEAPLTIARRCIDCAIAASATHYLFVANDDNGIRHTLLSRDLSQAPAPLTTASRPKPHRDVRVFQLPQTSVVLWLEQASSSEWDIYAARVQNGQHLDGRGAQVARFQVSAIDPERDWVAATDGQRVMVAWRGLQQNVEARLIDAGGIATGPFVIRDLSPQLDRSALRTLLWTGEHFALIWTREIAPFGSIILSYRLLTSGGAVVRDGDIDLAGTTFHQPIFVRAGDEWRLLGIRGGRELTLLPLRSDFSTAGPPMVIATATDAILPRLAVSDGADRIFVAWTVVTTPFPRPGAPTVDIQFRAVVDASGRIVRPAEPAEGVLAEGIWTGTSFLVLPFGSRTILRFSRDGAPLAPVAGTLDYFTWPLSPRFATGASGTVVTYAGNTADDGEGDSFVAMLRAIFEPPTARRRSTGH